MIEIDRSQITFRDNGMPEIPGLTWAGSTSRHDVYTKHEYVADPVVTYITRGDRLFVRHTSDDVIMNYVGTYNESPRDIDLRSNGLHETGESRFGFCGEATPNFIEGATKIETVPEIDLHEINGAEITLKLPYIEDAYSYVNSQELEDGSRRTQAAKVAFSCPRYPLGTEVYTTSLGEYYLDGGRRQSLNALGNALMTACDDCPVKIKAQKHIRTPEEEAAIITASLNSNEFNFANE